MKHGGVLWEVLENGSIGGTMCIEELLNVCAMD